MTARLLLLAMLASGLAQAELKLFLWAGGTETPITPYMNIGSAAAGETLEVRFRARNTGPEAVSIQTLSAKGTGFSLYGPPDLPNMIAPGNFLNIFVHFQPAIAGKANAVLTVNTITVTLIADGTSAPVVQTGSVTVSNGSLIDWGPVERDTAHAQTITLRNLSSAAATVNRVEVQGAAFRLGAAINTPVRVEVNQSLSFEIIFQPTVDGAQTGSLLVDERSYELRGSGLAPPLPEPRLVLDSTAAGSSRQLKLRVSLASASKSSASGTVQMQFKPAAGLADDPTVHFLPSARVQTITVKEGEQIARFGSSDSVTFQTGTTAGQIVFTIQMGGYSSQATVTVAPSIVVLDMVLATRESGRVVVQMVGYDNVRTADQLSFTFYDGAGRFLGPGAIRVNAGNDFTKYFQTTAAGGAFNLVATFPVTGNVSTIDSVDVMVTNSVGSTATNHVSF